MDRNYTEGGANALHNIRMCGGGAVGIRRQLGKRYRGILPARLRRTPQGARGRGRRPRRHRRRPQSRRACAFPERSELVSFALQPQARNRGQRYAGFHADGGGQERQQLLSRPQSGVQLQAGAQCVRGSRRRHAIRQWRHEHRLPGRGAPREPAESPASPTPVFSATA